MLTVDVARERRMEGADGCTDTAADAYGTLSWMCRTTFCVICGLYSAVLKESCYSKGMLRTYGLYNTLEFIPDHIEINKQQPRCTEKQNLFSV